MKKRIMQEDEKFIRRVEIPESTKSYQPLSHGQQIDITLQEAKHEGFELIGSPGIAYAKEGLEFIGSFNFMHPSITDKEVCGRLVDINSYNKKKSAKVAAGGNVFACTNGMLIADYIMSRKHTPGNEKTRGVVDDFKDMVRRGLKLTLDQFPELVDTKERMKSVNFDTKTTAWLVDQLFYKEDLLTMHQMQALKNEMYFSENFAVDKNGNLTLWNFYNNVTEVLKTTRANQNADKHLELHKYTMENLIEGKF